MNRNNFTAILFVFCVCLTLVSAQSYSPPTHLSSLDVANWVIRGGQIASGTAAPTGVASEGALYIDETIATAPALWRYGNGGWAMVAGGGGVSEALAEHVASHTDPHGATMTVTQEVNIGDPAEPLSVNIDSPEPGACRIASYILLIPLATHPTTIGPAVYFNEDGHFYGYASSSWKQLDN